MLQQFALASLIANIAIVVTGGAVRLTGSGLGCPTWPRCDGTSYVTTPAQGYHGVIEFTNRSLTFIVTVLAALCLIAAWAQSAAEQPGRRSRIWWAVGVLASIPAQAVLGGITVLTKLNPWVVASHFLVSIVIIAVAYQLWVRARDDAPPAPGPGRPFQALTWAITGVTAAVVVAGTITTGSGPHAGDEHARRTGLRPDMIAQFHTDLVMLLVGLSVAAWFALRVTRARAARAAAILVIVECAQALIGFVQYFTNLPIILVGAHMLGACLVWVAALRLLTATSPAPAGWARPSVGVPAARTAERV